MLQPFLQFIQTENLFQKNDRILLAVSGGMDSVSMVHLFKEAGISFGIAHCNFQLRGDESDGDESFVKALAEKLGVPFFSTCFETQKFVDEKKISIQMAARELRYDWFEKIRKDNNFQRIALAHHFNDSMETVLLNLTKGTGIAGLHGISSKHEKIIRPLLCFTREQIEAFVKENKIEYREDRSNSSDKYQRNLIRNKIIPLMKEINPSLDQTFKQNIDHFKDAEDIYITAIRQFKKSLLLEDGFNFKIPIKKLQQLPASETILFELIKDFGFNSDQVKEIITCLDEQAGKQFFSEGYRLIKDRQFLFITPNLATDSTVFWIDEKTRNISFGHFHLRLKAIEHISTYTMSHSADVGEFDHDKIQFPLQLRYWQKGDYFYPLGLGKRNNPDKPGKKKISDLLTDLKMPLHEKEKVAVLLSGDHIIWAIGLRMDERFKISPQTKRILRIELH